jgi:integrase
LRDYLALRRSVGFKLETAGQLLPKFVDYLHHRRASRITCELALAWAMLPRDKRRWWAVRLSLVRGFARFLHARDPRTEVPPLDLLPQGRWRATPYLYSQTEISALVRAARALGPPLLAATCSAVIGLLAATGMRRGEVIALDRQDIDWQQGILLVRNSKFGKSRELPLHPTTLDALRSYARVRDRLFPRGHEELLRFPRGHAPPRPSRPQDLPPAVSRRRHSPALTSRQPRTHPWLRPKVRRGTNKGCFDNSRAWGSTRPRVAGDGAAALRSAAAGRAALARDAAAPRRPPSLRCFRARDRDAGRDLRSGLSRRGLNSLRACGRRG